jgi:hypothetical protein
MGDEDASRARLGGEVGQLRPSVNECLEAVVAEASVRLASMGWATDSHAEPLEDTSERRRAWVH